jgi:hypothetical protein
MDGFRTLCHRVSCYDRIGNKPVLPSRRVQHIHRSTSPYIKILFTKLHPSHLTRHTWIDENLDFPIMEARHMTPDSWRLEENNIIAAQPIKTSSSARNEALGLIVLIEEQSPRSYRPHIRERLTLHELCVVTPSEEESDLHLRYCAPRLMLDTPWAIAPRAGAIGSITSLRQQPLTFRTC